jgi:DNA invertase Pin-like site-specific DNA recombinase
LHRLLDQLRERDTIVVWKLDRLSRSLKDVLHIMERIAAAGGGFRSLTENIDTTTAAGRMMMQMVGAFADDAVSAVMRSGAARTQELPGLLGARCSA